MKPFSSLRLRLVWTVFVAIAPACALMYLFDLPWMGFVMGLLALAAAWYGGERFILRQVRDILESARRLAAGDLTSRTRRDKSEGDLGELAQAFDQMAEAIETRARESQAVERLLLNRAQQQTVVAALGQFALISQDFNALLNQAVTMVAQTLEVEFTYVMSLQADEQTLLLQAGIGWTSGWVGTARIEAVGDSQACYVLTSGEPVVVTDVDQEQRFVAPAWWLEHGIQSGVAVVISTRHRPFGVLGACAGVKRSYTDEEVNFLVAVGTALGLAAERYWAETELQKLATFAQLSPNPALELAADGSVTYYNEAAQRLTRSVRREFPGEVLPPDVAQIVKTCLLKDASKVRYETKVEGRTLSWAFHPVTASQAVHCYVDDITDRLNLEAQLRQSQKMESVGQLAAGVAHDFNNMLTIIQGHAGILLAKADPAKKNLTDSAQAIYFASERAAGLTRQLLVFSRKNVIQRKLLDLREVVGNMSKMLRRLIGETVALEFTPPSALPLVHGDTGMIEQVLMNLVVNARDAMPKGGALAIQLERVEASPAFIAAHPAAREGLFVCLRVTDTGVGMDTTLIGRIFEPFFTTKEVGKGTGLGLATVYGIVNQHDGWIEVASEVGRGSTFSVYLPANQETAQPAKRDGDPGDFVAGGTETILVVEDEGVLRDMAFTILREGGYRILTAGTGWEALEFWEQEQGKIDLLLTDMVMPEGMSGVDLAEKLLARQPKLKVLFASGYTVDEVSEAFLQKNNARFLQKPYNRVTLSNAVRQVLDNSHAGET
jgi:signal transduction histidine kinase/ActR/RegA family two-component response regulator